MPMAVNWRTAAVLLLQLLVLLRLSGCSGQCLLAFDIANSSSVELTGTTVHPVSLPILLEGTPDYSLDGRIYLQLTGACPASADSLGTSAPQNASLVAQAGSQVTVLPALLDAQVGPTALASLEISGIQFNLTSDPQTLQLDTPYSSKFYAGITNGSVLVSTNLAGGANKPASLIGATGNSTANITVSLQVDTLQLEISNLNLTFGSSFSLSGIAGFSYYFLAANLTAQAELTAQPGPAPVQVPSPEPFLQPAGTAPAAAPTPLAASGAGAQSIMSPAFAPLAGQSLSAIQPLGCTYGSDPSCSSCENGWTGAYCDVCLSDNVCNAELGTDNAVCNNSAIYTSETVFKSYDCNISNSVVGTVLSSFALACNTTQITDSKGRKGGYCQVGLKVQSAPDNGGVCVVTGCMFQDGSSKFQCQDAICSCAQGACPSDIASYTALIEGNSVEVECTANGTCTVNIANFPVQVSLPCTFGDCQSPDNPALFSSATFTGAPRSYAAAIAAIPLMVLAVLALTALCSSLATSSLWQQASPRRKSQQSFDLSAAQHDNSTKVTELRFSRISCSVAGSRFGSRHHYSHIDSLRPNSAKAERVTDAQVPQALNGHDKAVVTDPKADAATQAPISRNPSAFCENLDDLLIAGDACTVGRAPLPARRGLLETVRAALRPRRKLLILRNISGLARAGELVGILGPSGSGKTTLLSILADSTSALSASSRVYGHVALDSVPREQLPRGLVAYVPQSDYLLPTLTVREVLWYSARLRLPGNSSAVQVEERVAGVLEELGLLEVADTQVGGAHGIRGISGGERRRVVIGSELVTNASILLLDEPSSGLDSHTAARLILSLQQVARAGRIVVLSIHQPSPQMFSTLDLCYLMCRGQIAFTGRPADAEGFLLSAGLPCPPGTPAAEHLLTVASEPSLRDCLLEFAQQAAQDKGKGSEPGNVGFPSQARSRQRGQQRVALTTELAVLSWRTLVDIWRNPGLLLLHIGIGVVMGVLVGAIFLNLTNDVAGAQGRLGVVFFTLCLAALTSLTTVDLLTDERTLVARETQAQMYRAVTYYLAKATLDAIFLRVLPTVIYAIPVYAMAKLHSGADRVALFFCVAAVFAAAVGALSMAVTVGCNSAGKASLVMNVLLLLSLLFAGYLKDVDTITPVLRWLHYLSVFYYSFESMVINEVSGLVFQFSAGKGLSATLTGDTFLSTVNLHKSYLVRDVALLNALYAGFVAIGISLLYLTLPRPLRLRKPT